MGLGSPADFWALTPRQFDIAFEGALARRKAEMRRATFQAWLAARLGGFRDVPDFESLFPEDGASEDDDGMSDEQLMARMNQWRAATALASPPAPAST
jgi:hypothetical protein